MTSKQETQIAKRRAQMPRSYRACYDKAISGKSLRSAINSFCLECICWQIEEIRNCTDLACPLYAVRPYQLPQKARDDHSARRESKNSDEKVSEQGEQ